MDYEKMYNEAQERAKRILCNLPEGAASISDIENIFPELRESEDERIRKAIIKSIEEDSSVYEQEVSKEQMLAYLEKQKELPFVKDVVPGLPGLYFYDGERMHFQGNPATEENPYDFAMSQQEKQKEQKYIGLSETDKFFLEGVANVLVDNEYKDAAKRLRDLSESLYLQPKAGWSEEDERLMKTSISFLKDFADTGWENAVECIDWLKYLRPSWKPTYEQMEALRKAVNKLADTEVADSVRLSIMYDHLKELM